MFPHPHFLHLAGFSVMVDRRATDYRQCKPSFPTVLFSFPMLPCVSICMTTTVSVAVYFGPQWTKADSQFHLVSSRDCYHGDAPLPSLRLDFTWPSPSPGVWPASGGLHWFGRIVGLFVWQPVRNWSHPLPTGGTLTSPQGLSFCLHRAAVATQRNWFSLRDRLAEEGAKQIRADNQPCVVFV